MKVALVLVSVFVVFASSSSIQKRGIFDGMKKFKDFLDYLQSQELKDIVHDIETHMDQAPDKAIECFVASTEDTKGDRQAAIDALEDLFHKAFNQDGSKNKNLFEKLLDYAHGIAIVLEDPEFGKNIKEIGSEYQEAVGEAVECFKDELKAIKGDVDDIIASIKSKFF